MPRYSSPSEQFLAHYSKCTHEPGPLPTPCHMWQSSRMATGYGQFGTRKFHAYAHRFSYTHFIGQIPEGMMVLHICDKPTCVNPLHLYVGSQKDNMRDRHKGHPTGTQKDRLETTLKRTTRSGECMLWTHDCDQDGRPRYRVEGKPRLAHRCVYEHFVGEIPPGRNVIRVCGNKKCVNPEHLSLGP